MNERALVACALALALSTGAQAAPARDPIIVLESYVGQRLDRGNELVSELRDELEALGFAAHPSTIMAILGQRAPRPGILDKGATAAGLTRAELVDPVDVGYQAWAVANFEEAKSILVRAISRIRRNPAVLVTDTSNLNVIYKAHLALALSMAKLGEAPQSEAVMRELIRMFPTQPISREEFGPEAWELYRSVARQVRAMGRGRLIVSAGNDRAIIFVDGQLRGTGKIELGDMVPGVHHVFMQVIGTVGRRYEIEVIANQASTLKVTWELDASLWVTDSWVGVVFPTEADRAKEGAVESELMRRWGGAAIAVIAPEQLRGRPAMLATLYGAGGEVARSATVVLGGDPTVRLRSLARFLADGTEEDGVDVRSRGNAPAPAGHDAPPRSRPRWVTGAILGGGILTTVAGVAVWKTGGIDNGEIPTLRDPRRIGVGIALGGSAAIGAGVYLWCRGSRTISPRAAALLGGGAAAISAGVALLLVDEDPGHRLGAVYFDSAPTGGAVGLTGLALAGAGAWLWLRHDASSPPPVASLSRGGATIAWATRF